MSHLKSSNSESQFDPKTAQAITVTETINVNVKWQRVHRWHLWKRYGPPDTFLKKIIRSFGGFFFGLLFTMMYALILLFVKNYDVWFCVLATITIGIFVGFGMGFSVKVRATMALMAPQIFAVQGKTFILLAAFTLALIGPVSNILENFNRAAVSVSCNAEVALNQTKELIDKVKQPLLGVLSKLKAIAQKGKAAADKVRRFFKALQHAIKHIVRALRNIWYFLLQITDICNEELGKPYYKCAKIFDDAFESCMRVIPFLFFLCYIVLLFRFLCLIAKLLTLFCIIPQFIQAFLRKHIAEPIMKAIDFVKRQFDFNITVIHKFDIDISASKSISQVAADIMADIEQRIAPYRDFLAMFGYVASFFAIYVYLKALSYRKRYLYEDSFDNIYITSDFIQIDYMRARQGKSTVLPLLSSESRKYLTPGSWFMTRLEKKRYLLSLITVIRQMIIVILLVLMDYAIFWILDMIRFHLQREFTARAPVVVQVQVSGTGYASDIFRDVVSSFDELQKGNISVMSKKCFLNPSEPDYRVYLIIGLLYGIAIFVVLFGAYVYRLQRVICASYYPAREQDRICYLYNSILRRRLTISRTLVSSVARNTTDDQRPRFMAKWVSRWKFLKKHISTPPKYCVACGLKYVPSNSEFFIPCITPGCKGFYCMDCYKQLGNVCIICRGPLTYADLADIEVDSSDEELDKDTEATEASSTDESELDFSYQNKSEFSEEELEPDVATKGKKPIPQGDGLIQKGKDASPLEQGRRTETEITSAQAEDTRPQLEERSTLVGGIITEGETTSTLEDTRQRVEEISTLGEDASWEVAGASERMEDTSWWVEDTRRKKEDSRRWEEDTRRREEDTRRREEDSRRWEEDTRREIEDTRRRAEDANQGVEGTSQRLKDSRRMEEDTRRREEDARRKKEDTRRQMEDTRRRAEDTRREVEDTRREVEDTRRRIESTSLGDDSTCIPEEYTSQEDEYHDLQRGDKSCILEMEGDTQGSKYDSCDMDDSFPECEYCSLDKEGNPPGSEDESLEIEGDSQGSDVDECFHECPKMVATSTRVKYTGRVKETSKEGGASRRVEGTSRRVEGTSRRVGDTRERIEGSSQRVGDTRQRVEGTSWRYDRVCLPADYTSQVYEYRTHQRGNKIQGHKPCIVEMEGDNQESQQDSCDMDDCLRECEDCSLDMEGNPPGSEDESLEIEGDSQGSDMDECFRECPKMMITSTGVKYAGRVKDTSKEGGASRRMGGTSRRVEGTSRRVGDTRERIEGSSRRVGDTRQRVEGTSWRDDRVCLPADCTSQVYEYRTHQRGNKIQGHKPCIVEMESDNQGSQQESCDMDDCLRECEDCSLDMEGNLPGSEDESLAIEGDSQGSDMDECFREYPKMVTTSTHVKYTGWVKDTSKEGGASRRMGGTSRRVEGTSRRVGDTRQRKENTRRKVEDTSWGDDSTCLPADYTSQVYECHNHQRGNKIQRHKPCIVEMEGETQESQQDSCDMDDCLRECEYCSLDMEGNAPGSEDDSLEMEEPSHESEYCSHDTQDTSWATALKPSKEKKSHRRH